MTLRSEQTSDSRSAVGSTPLSLTLLDPVVCRSPGLPFARLEAMGRETDPGALWQLLDDGEFVDCLATMNPGALQSLRSRRRKLRPGHRPSNIRRAELTLYRYLTRFCSRNDTTGTAGSTFWGTVGTGPAKLVPTADGGKSKVIWISPRHIELLCHQAADGPLRDRAVLVLWPRYDWTGSELLDRHDERSLALSPEERRLIGQVAGGTPALGALEAPLRPVAEGLLERNILTLRLGNPHHDAFEVLRELSPGTPLAAPVEQLADLRVRLSQARGEAFEALSLQADAVARHLVDTSSLDLTEIVRLVVRFSLQDPALRLVASRAVQMDGEFLMDASAGTRRRLSPAETDVLQRCQSPVAAPTLLDQADALRDLLDQGTVTLEGANDFRPGWPWKTRFGQLTRALNATGLEEPLASVARLLAAVQPDEPPRMSPVEAEAALGRHLGKRREALSLPGLDRSFFICDSRRNVQTFVLGDAIRQRLEKQLPSWFRLAAWQAYNRERAMHPVLRTLAEDAKDVPLSRFLDSFVQAVHHDEIDYKTPALQTLRQRLIEEDDRQWKVSGDARTGLNIEEVGNHPGFDTWLDARRLVATLDLMLGGTPEEIESGGGTLLISEAHGGCEGLGETTLFPQSHPGVSLQDHALGAFGENTLFLQPPMLNKLTCGVLRQLQQSALALNNPEGWWPQACTVPIGSLMVRKTPQGLLVHDGKRAWRLVTELLSVGNIQTVGYLPFSISRWACSKIAGRVASEGLETYPEIRLGGLVLCRPSRLARTAFLLALLESEGGGRRLAETLELPRFTFVKTSRKPMLCDFESPLSMETLVSELGKADFATLSPMGPGPDDLWLRLEDGRYTSELRLVAMCQGSGFVDGPDGCYLSL